MSRWIQPDTMCSSLANRWTRKYRNTLYSKSYIATVRSNVDPHLQGLWQTTPPVPEQSPLAFSASSQYSHRFNSESSVILVYNTLKQKRWQLLPHRYKETERRNFPFSGGNSSRLSLVVLLF